jgi:D-xylose transport system substrate-binding protein
MDLKKNLKVVGLALLSVGLLTHCTKKETAVSTASPQGSADAQKPLRIGFVLATMNEERYGKDKKYFEEFASAAGASVEFASCDNKVDVQTAKVETLLSKNIDALVIQPVNSEAASSLVALAKRDNVPVIAYDRVIRNGDIDAYVTQNSFQVGVLQAEEAVTATGGKGNFVILMGEAGHSVADEITRGNLSVLEKHPSIKVVVKQNHPGWSTALALATVENALTRNKNKIDAILANNDGMALGAIQALEEQKLVGKVFVAGADADLAAVKDVAKGRQSMTVLKGIKPLAKAAVETAVQLARKQPINADAKLFNGLKEVSVVNTPVEKVTKANLQETLIDSGFHTKEAVYGTPGR